MESAQQRPLNTNKKLLPFSSTKEALNSISLSLRMKTHSAGLGTFLENKGLLDVIGPFPSVALDKSYLVI